MDIFNNEIEKEKREKEALERHARLHKLFIEDRLSFERERKRAINELLNSIKDDETRNKMRAIQESWDEKMKNAGSGENRLILAQKLFLEHFYGTWVPFIQKFSSSSGRI